MEWTGARYADQPTAEAETLIAATQQRVWELVSDITVMPLFSDELQSVEWLDGTTTPHVGARFAGHSKHSALGEWTTQSQIVELQPPSVFAWAVGDPEDPSARWRFDVRPDPAGAILRYQVKMGPGPSGLSLAIERMPDKEEKIVFVRMREFEHGIQATLAGIRELAEDGAR